MKPLTKRQTLFVELKIIDRDIAYHGAEIERLKAEKSVKIIEINKLIEVEDEE